MQVVGHQWQPCHFLSVQIASDIVQLPLVTFVRFHMKDSIQESLLASAHPPPPFSCLIYLVCLSQRCPYL